MDKVKHNNGNRYANLVREKAKTLRKLGKTHREIVKELGISLGSASLWTEGIVLTTEQKKAIQERSYKTAFTIERSAKLRESARINLTPYREKYTREDLLNKIVSFFNQNGRIPLKREFNMYHEYNRRFGSWNNAIKITGFKTNPILFSYKFIAKDGHRCDSFTEKIIDDWLCVHQISHSRNFKYGKTKMTADFFINPNTIVEFFGLAGVQKKYDDLIKIKKELVQELNLKLIEVYPKDLFPKNRLSELIKI